jgi:hypothetical protein
MKIFKVAEEKVAPTWAFGNESLDTYKDKEAVNLERLNTTSAIEVSEDTIVKECDQIEHCASSGKTYHYNSSWKPSQVSQLKEYALACGLDLAKFKPVDPQAVRKVEEEITVEASNNRNIKVAAKESGLKLDLGDPFHLDDKADISHMDVANWQEVKKQTNMKDAPVMTSGIVPVRGGEDYFTNSNIKANAKNQNSISDPDAIKTMVESTEQDNGARLKEQIKAKETAKKQAHAEWQKDIVDSMEHKEIVPRGNVFPTESMNAQSGVSSPSCQGGV